MWCVVNRRGHWWSFKPCDRSSKIQFSFAGRKRTGPSRQISPGQWRLASSKLMNYSGGIYSHHNPDPQQILSRQHFWPRGMHSNMHTSCFLCHAHVFIYNTIRRSLRSLSVMVYTQQSFKKQPEAKLVKLRTLKQQYSSFKGQACDNSLRIL